MRTTYRRFAYHFALAAGLWLLARPAAAQLTPQLAAQLQQDLTTLRGQTGAHGLSAAVLFPNQTIWTGSTGMASPTDSLTPATLLGVGSITKTFTAALVLRLAARGQIQLDDSIGQHVPLVMQYPNIDPGVTVRQLLSHTSGVDNYTENPQFLTAVTSVSPTHLFTTADVLGWVRPMRFTPGARWAYSNTGYTLLGLLIEHVTGTSLSRAYRVELLDPLNLASTWRGYGDTIPSTLTVSDGWIQNVTNGPFVVNVGGSRNAFFSSSFGDGELLSTPTDLVRWAHALYGTTTVLDSTSLALMLTVDPRSVTAGLPYGLGVMRTMRRGRVMWGHNGSIPGYMATFGYVPTCGVAVAVMVNESNPVTENAVNRLFVIINRAVCAALGVPEATTTLSLSLHPNPAQGNVTLTYQCPPGTRQAWLEVFDALGRSVRVVALQTIATETTLDLTGLPAGFYACRIRADDRSGRAVRLVVQ